MSDAPMPGTPLPWRYAAGEVQAFTDGKPGIVIRRKIATVSIAHMGSEERDANAAYIVWACNNAPDLYEAASALIADVRRRYPGEELRCEYMRALDAAIARAKP